jgi:hypothetical protein
MPGEWKLRNRFYAHVTGEMNGFWYGVIHISQELHIPSYWTHDGNSPDTKQLDLVQKRRGNEVF